MYTIDNYIELYSATPTEDTLRAILTQSYKDGYAQGKADAVEKTVERFEMMEASDITEKSFIEFWNLYDKKVGLQTCKSLWKRLTKRERRICLEYVPLYVMAQPDKRYRKNPATFLRQRAWNDELIPSRYASIQQRNMQNSEDAQRLAEALARFDLDSQPSYDASRH